MSIDLGVMGAKVNLNTNGFDRGVKKITSGFSDMGKKAIVFNQALELSKKTWSVIGGTAKKALSEMERGAKRVDLENIFGNLALNAGRDATKMMEQLKKATKGVATEMEAMAATNQALISGMDFDQVTVTMEYLQKYAKAANKDFSQLSNTIMTGLVRGSTQLLDDAGIIIDQTSLLAEKTEEYGRALSETEKKQALVNAAIDQMKQKMPALGGEITTQYDQIQSWKAAWADMQDRMGKWALRGYGFMRGGFDGLKLGWTDAKILLLKIESGFKDHFGNIVMVVNQAMMDVAITIRDNLSHMLASFGDVDNAIVKPMKAGLDLAVQSLDTALSAMFDMNLNMLSDESSINTQLDKLYNERAAIIQGGQQWVDLASGKFAEGGTIPSIDLSGSSIGGVGQITDTIQTLQGQIDQLTFDNATMGLAEFEYQIAAANFEAEKLQEQYASLIPENPAIDDMIEKIRVLKVENAAMVKDFEKNASRFEIVDDAVKGATNAMAQTFGNTLAELAKTGKANLKELVKSLVETLQVFAAQKTAHLTMLGLYHSVMAFVDRTQATYHSESAAKAYTGAGVMGSFVAGSGLAGMAHDGITNIPEDGTWLLKKNERVVDDRTNADLKGFLANGGGGNSGREINIEKIEINNSDENGVLKALPALRKMIVDTINEDITGYGPTYKTIQGYT